MHISESAKAECKRIPLHTLTMSGNQETKDWVPSTIVPVQVVYVWASALFSPSPLQGHHLRLPNLEACGGLGERQSQRIDCHGCGTYFHQSWTVCAIIPRIHVHGQIVRHEPDVFSFSLSWSARCHGRIAESAHMGHAYAIIRVHSLMQACKQMMLEGLSGLVYSAINKSCRPSSQQNYC